MCEKSLPVGAQSKIAAELGLSRQAVSRVLKGHFQNKAVLARANEIAAEYANSLRAQAYRSYINSLSDEDLITLLNQSTHDCKS
ncbi:hypothetical protein GCM10027348_32090 [Hymenobacter tenuis]